MDAARVPIRFRHLFRNYVSLAGGLIAGIGFGTNIFLILIDLLTPSHNPYVGIVTYMLLPGITMAGLGLTAVGGRHQFCAAPPRPGVPRTATDRPEHAEAPDDARWIADGSSSCSSACPRSAATRHTTSPTRSRSAGRPATR